MTVSIIIPTLHRKDSLIRLLTNLKHTKHEIIVVEQEENNGNAFRAVRPVVYRYLARRSTPRAMNAGVREAKGDLVLFLDDDVTVTTGCIAAHTRTFTDPRVAATVGRIITDGQHLEPDRKDTGKINWIGECSDGFSSIHRQEVDTVIGANTCWRKRVLMELGGFDERFTGNALRFETDMSLRAKRAGYKIIFEPKALVYHHRVETGGARKTEGRIRWYRDYFKNEALFFLKHRPAWLFPLFFWNKLVWAATNI